MNGEKIDCVFEWTCIMDKRSTEHTFRMEGARETATKTNMSALLPG